MSNYNNIKPYNDLSHAAKMHGGPEAYLQELTESSYSRGMEDGKSSVAWKVPAAAGIGVATGAALYELIRFIWSSVSSHKAEKKMKAIAREMELKEKILTEFSDGSDRITVSEEMQSGIAVNGTSIKKEDES